jgi:P-type Mg2+ transporter
VPRRTPPPAERALGIDEAAALEAPLVLARLGSSATGLTSADARSRLDRYGPNALGSRSVRASAILLRQLRSYLLILLVGAAGVSAVVGDVTEAAIILAIVALSVGLGFVNEYRSAQAVAALHSQLKRRAIVLRDGRSIEEDVTRIVPGDVVVLHVGDVVPADLRLLSARGLECDESVLTGESLPTPKGDGPAEMSDSPLDLACVAFMGTVVHGGGGRGVVVQTGGRTAFGEIALRLGEHQDETSFQRGLQQFSRMLVAITGGLVGSILVLNLVFGRSALQSLLFALAIAVGLTPQLLPAIVTVSLASGARRLAARSVIVKRLVCIEDLGNVQVLFTDKTGTLTEGQIAFAAALDTAGNVERDVLELGLVASDETGNSLDRALWQVPEHARAAASRWQRHGTVPFDHERQVGSAVVTDPEAKTWLVTKGAPEAVFARCRSLPANAAGTLEQLFAAGTRVIALAARAANPCSTPTAQDEHDLELRGFLCFSDPPKLDAAESLKRLAALGIEVKLVTGDNGKVAEKVCADLGVPVLGTLTGAEIAGLNDAELQAALPRTSIFARVTPDQKSRIIRAARAGGADVGFLGDGVNDAIALHDADVGISVESASDVAKDAADVVLLTKDLGILADGVVEGRRIFANTIKYVLMGTSSNFGNMFSAAGASLFLSFLPMLPTQILLNNLLYDVSELTIPTDEVDEELLARPSQWDIGFIRRFMAVFGPISSIYDFLTFAVMLLVFHADATLFRSGWFVESLATQSLVIFVIRTRRIPFFRSRPSRPLLIATISCASVGVALPYSPLASLLGFRALPPGFLAILVVMVVTYLALVETGKRLFFRGRFAPEPLARPRPRHERRIERRAARWTLHGGRRLAPSEPGRPPPSTSP